jgi:hypothetical protein
VNSRIKFLRRVRIHGEECGAVARALHHEVKRNSLPAVIENVSVTTFERKSMLNKTIFKRIALAVVTALGAGVLTTLSVTGAAATPHGGDVLTVGTPSKTSVVQGDTVSVTVDYSWTTTVAGETATVLLGGDQSDFAQSSPYQGAYIVASSTDSANVTNHGVIAGGTAITSSSGDTVTATDAGTYSRAKFTIYLPNFTAPATAKTVTYTVAIRSGGATGPIEQSANFTLTLNAKDTVGVASKSLVWLNNSLTTAGVNAPRADSTLVVSAGTAASPAAVGYIWQEARNASDTTNSTTSTSRDVDADFTVTITGPGTLDYYNNSGGTYALTATKAKSVTVDAGETIVVYSDGTAGTATITSYIGSTALTQAAKTINFFGKPATITATVDSAAVSSASTANRMISFVVKDSAGNALSDVGTVYNTGTPGGGFYAVYSDTTVVSGTAAIAGGTAAYTLCSTYSATAAKWYCNLAFNDSGTATVTIVDSLTVGTAVISSSALTVVASGTAYTGTATFDKTTYNTGEKAILTVTAKDSGGRNVADGDSSPWAATVRWTSNAATTSVSTGSDDDGGTFTSLVDFLNSGSTNTFVGGVDTAVVYMPTVAGTYTVVGKGAGGTATTESTILTFTVVDPAQVTNLAAIAAAQAAADASADAAAEAIDAANAATDAANLAAEAADAATVAAEEARDAADAATAAVEELATQVATLMAALKAQITTLANTVAKIARKVKA